MKGCQGKIVSIMEGGVEVFERRKTIYQIWKAGASQRRDMSRPVATACDRVTKFLNPVVFPQFASRKRG